MKSRNLLPFVILALFAYVILTLADTEALLALLAQSSPSFLFLAALSSLCSLLLFTRSWQWLFFALEERIPFPALFVTFVAGIFSSTLNPVGRVGSEGVKLFLLNKKDRISLENATASILLKNLFGFLVIAFLILLFLLLIVIEGTGERLARLALWGILFMGGGIAFCLVVLADWGGRVTSLFLSLLVKVGGRITTKADAWAKWVELFLESLRQGFGRAMRHPASIASSLFACLLGWGFLYLTTRLVFFALHVSLPLGLMCLIVTLAEIGSLLPIPAGMSGTDIALTFLYSLSGLSLETSLACALLGRFFVFYLPMMVGGIASFLLSLYKGF